MQASDITASIPRICERALRKTKPYEFTTFLIGSSLPKHLDKDTSQELRREVNRAVAKYLLDRVPDLRTDHMDPQLTIQIEVDPFSIRVRPASIYIYGRYLKENRELPQTRWHCKVCRGRGCQHCGGKGKMYPTSVEELISQPFLEQTAARSSKMHGMGREDVDARMLGTGRPFVVEMVQPRVRTIDFEKAIKTLAEVQTKGVTVNDLRPVSREIKKLVKEVEPDKTYLARVVTERPIAETESTLQHLGGLAPLIVHQQTPQRVLHRRADRVRRRRILELGVIPRGPNELDLKITAEAGTYIKEFITGDDHRTTPSLTEILQTSCLCRELDVLDIEFDLDEVLRFRSSLA